MQVHRLCIAGRQDQGGSLSLLRADVRVMSGLLPIATELRTSLVVRFVPNSEVARFAKDEIVAVVFALPEPLAVLALMNGGIELRDREKLVTAHETSFVAEAGEIGKHIPDTAGREMAVLAFENQQWRRPAQNPLGAPWQTKQSCNFFADFVAVFLADDCPLTQSPSAVTSLTKYRIVRVRALIGNLLSSK
jgi:hypothetical protein